MKLLPEDIQEIRFLVVKGANPGSKVNFEPGLRSVRIGRAADNEIVINDPTVSRNHVRVDIRNDGNFICDLGSSAGVEKMGFRVGQTPEPLQSGDELKIGDTILRFEVVAKKGAMRRAAAREAAEKAGPVTGGSPIQRALARIGLRTPATQLAAAAGVAALLVIGLWPRGPSLPPQSKEPLPLNFDAAIGFNSADQAHLDAAVFKIPTDAEGLGIYVDFIGGSEVEVRTKSRVIGKMPPTGNWIRYELLVLTRAIAAGGSAEMTFDNLGYSPADGDIDPAKAKQWALSRMWAARVPSAASSPGVLANELRALRELYDHLPDDPKNRYSLLKGLRTSVLGLMKISGRAVLILPIPSGAELKEANLGDQLDSARDELDKEHLSKGLDLLAGTLAQAEGELDREYRRNLNAVLLARKRQAPTEERASLQVIVAMIPEPTDPRQRSAVADLRKLGINP
jgi:FHA domain